MRFATPCTWLQMLGWSTCSKIQVSHHCLSELSDQSCWEEPYPSQCTCPQTNAPSCPAWATQHHSGSRANWLRTLPPAGNALTGPAPELCKGFARGHCHFGNTCRYLHEMGMPPPAARAPHAPAQQK
ncbi:TPA: hypothetical protein ACH3X1_000903 [Trebouxia sp. C0004]